MKRGLTIPLLLVCAVFFAGCADSKDDNQVGRQANSEGSLSYGGPVAAVPGCQAAEATPQEKTSRDRVIRCKKGTPKPIPLDQRQTITLNVPAPSISSAWPVMWAEAAGEFEKENLNVEIQSVPSSSAVQLLAQGKLDVTWSSMGAYVYNAIYNGYGLQWIMTAYRPSVNSMEGLWGLKGHVDTMAELKGGTIGSFVGPGSSLTYLIDQALSQHGLSITDIRLKKVPHSAMITAVERGAVDAAFLISNDSVRAASTPDLVYLGGRWTDLINGALASAKVMREQPRALLAFVRAVIRTYNTYFAGDYRSDEAFLSRLAEVTDTTVSVLKKAPPANYEWAIQKGVTTAMQETFIEVGVLDYRKPMPERRIVERSYYRAAVGVKGGVGGS